MRASSEVYGFGLEHTAVCGNRAIFNEIPVLCFGFALRSISQFLFKYYHQIGENLIHLGRMLAYLAKSKSCLEPQIHLMLQGEARMKGV
jgi:hypothetical protein